MSEDQEKRRLRDEVAELAQAVRELREQLTQQRSCCHGHCYHWHYTPVPYYPTTTTLPYTVTYGGGTITTTNAYQAAIQ